MNEPRTVSFRAMGSAMEATLDGAPSARADAALAAVSRWFRAWERRLSRFDPRSELAALNAAWGAPRRASATLRRVVRAAIDAAKWTDGMVTPTLLDAIEAAGYDRSFELLAAARPAAAPPVTPARDAWRSVHVDDDARTIALPEGVRLDLGGTGKGWAADRAAARLSVHGPALVDAGGDIAMSGPRHGGAAWPVAVADPRRAEQTLLLLQIERGGVATSGTDYRRWRQGNVWKHHILDPRTGAPAETDVLSATVIGPSAREAEAAAKLVVILGSREGIDWIDAHPTLAAVVVRERGDVVASDRLFHYAA